MLIMEWKGRWKRGSGQKSFSKGKIQSAQREVAPVRGKVRNWGVGTSRSLRSCSAFYISSGVQTLTLVKKRIPKGQSL